MPGKEESLKILMFPAACMVKNILQKEQPVQRRPIRWRSFKKATGRNERPNFCRTNPDEERVRQLFVKGKILGRMRGHFILQYKP